MPTYSNSKLSTYENCPQQFKLRYIEKIELPDAGEGIEAFLGSRVHETLEKLHKELILEKLNTLDDLHAYFVDQWDKNWHNNILIMKKGFTEDNYKSAGKRAISDYYHRHQPFDQSRTLGTEQLITFTIDDYRIQGYIDRLGLDRAGVYEIHDYKTSGTLPTQERLDADRQLALYKIGVQEKFKDAKEVRLHWHYLLFDKEFTSERTEAQLRELKKEVVSLIKTIEKDSKYLPTEGPLCDWCEFPDYCPAKKHERKVESLPKNKYLQEKGVSLVNKFASIKQNIKALREQEKALQTELDLIAEAAIEYAHREDITKIVGSEFALKVTDEETYQFPLCGEEGRAELEKYIKKMGFWEDVSGLNISRLTKMLENDEFDSKVVNGLLKFAEEMNLSSVRLVKRKDVED